MSSLAITIIAIQSLIILLMAYPTWLVYMILSDKDVMAQLTEAKAKIDEFDSLSKHNQEYGDKVRAEWSLDVGITYVDPNDNERMALSEAVRDSHKLKYPRGQRDTCLNDASMGDDVRSYIKPAGES